MRQNFRPYEPDQLFLFPPSIDDWLAEDHVARFISHVVDELHARNRLEPIYRRYSVVGEGRAAYDPRMMLKVLFYAYCNGITSGRKIARHLQSDICFRYLSANQMPDYRTICQFRVRHAEDFEALFVEILALCRESGLMKLGRVALDGRRVPASANRRKNRTKTTIKAELRDIRDSVKEILKEAELVDQEEEELYEGKGGDELPAGMRNSKDRENRLQECLDRLEAKEREDQEEYERKVRAREERIATGGAACGNKPKPPKEKKNYTERSANPTDPDSRLMSIGGGSWIQAFNGQAAADCESQVIVGCLLTNEENDQHQLEPMLDAIERQAGARPPQALADSGYFNQKNLGLQDKNTELFLADKREYKRRNDNTPAPRGRIPKGTSALDLMRRKMKTKHARQIYKQRAPTIEGVFGQMWSRGLLRFNLRGLKKVSAEWTLMCLSHNLLKLFRSETASVHC